mgnify:CR=1 FL=1
MPTIIEFLLWDNCNNNCKFCFLKNGKSNKVIVTTSEKNNIFKYIKNYITNTNLFIPGNHLLLCGGEIFDTPMSESKKNWIDLTKTVVSSLKSNIIGEFYLNTNLLYDINMELTQFLDCFAKNNILHRVHFTTSYDLVGRFKDSSYRKLFLDNLIKIREQYPSLNIFVNTILTKQVCLLVQDRDFSVKDFQDTYKVKLNVIPYIVLDDLMAPSFSEVSNALLTIDAELPGFLANYTQNFEYDNPRKVLKYYTTDKTFMDVTANTNKCGHSINFTHYNKDTKSCFICDIKHLLESRGSNNG